MAVKKYQPLTLAPINFSLTEGTSIPAPLETPPDTPRPPTPGKGPLSSHPTPLSAVFPQNAGTPPSKGSTDSVSERPFHQTSPNDGNASTLSPTSPTGKRPSSVRKFLGLRTLSSSDSMYSDRPGSPATLQAQPSLQRKKSTGWFGKRKSTYIIGPVPEVKETHLTQAATNGAHANGKLASPPPKKGPPPPALPELKAFGASEDAFSFGEDDLFKNIK